ncbi:SOS response-associated peptidase family protein [Halobacteriovorax sp.]|uniref:SOS response-associated peptidase family protein n=1 Tax=Halobacteriovorax sp. TaxID=2020862 RepID=UPI0035636AE7
MCFSVQIDKNIKNLAKRFHSEVDVASFHQLKNMRNYASSLENEKLKSIMGLKRKPKTELFKTPEDDGRVYPGYFAPVITASEKGRTILPMRYRVRPNGSDEEIPSKYNVFNARVDSLEKRQTWSNLFMRNHGIFPFIKFFEWVEHKGRKELINFSPDEYEVMWAPCLWDFWRSSDEKIFFHSFALITDEPPKEIEERGHDRCPIFLKEEHIDSWLRPKERSRQEIYSLLRNIHDVHYSYEWAS